MQNFDNITAHGVVYTSPDRPPAELFWVDPKGHENFWCSVQGDRSGSSSSPRTEARETQADTSTSKNWGVAEADHSMTGALRVEMAPSSGKVIVAQVHAHKASSPFLMLTWWNGVARIDVRSHPDGETSKLLSLPCKLGQSFKYSIHLDADRTLRLNLNGLQYSTTVHPDWDAFPFYFKRGAYVIDHDGPAEEGGWVVYEACEVRHDPLQLIANI